MFSGTRASLNGGLQSSKTERDSLSGAASSRERPAHSALKFGEEEAGHLRDTEASVPLPLRKNQRKDVARQHAGQLGKKNTSVNPQHTTCTANGTTSYYRHGTRHQQPFGQFDLQPTSPSPSLDPRQHHAPHPAPTSQHPAADHTSAESRWHARSDGLRCRPSSTRSHPSSGCGGRVRVRVRVRVRIRGQG